MVPNRVHSLGSPLESPIGILDSLRFNLEATLPWFSLLKNKCHRTFTMQANIKMWLKYWPLSLEDGRIMVSGRKWSFSKKVGSFLLSLLVESQSRGIH